MNALIGILILVVFVAGAVLLASLLPASRRRAARPGSLGYELVTPEMPTPEMPAPEMPVPEMPAPERAEHWLITETARHPRLQRMLRSADRRVVGGSAVVACLVALGAAAIAVGWILDTVDTNRGFARWDRSVAQWGADRATPLTTDALRAITQLGDTVVVVSLLVAVAVFDYRRHRRPAVFGFVATIAIGVTTLNNTLKLLVDRERPMIDQLIGSAGSSFPSGHSATAAAGWAALVLLLERSSPRAARRWLMLGAVVVAVAVAASRALLGVHWLTDVIAGVIVGWTWFFLVAVVFGGRILRLGDPAARRPDGSLVLDHDDPALRVGDSIGDVWDRSQREHRRPEPRMIDSGRGIETGHDA
jgi:membrane-associated phospholipid phosphatase